MIAEGPGSIIDRYKLLQVIGEGGFGVVYMAEPGAVYRARSGGRTRVEAVLQAITTAAGSYAVTASPISVMTRSTRSASVRFP